MTQKNSQLRKSSDGYGNCKLSGNQIIPFEKRTIKLYNFRGNELFKPVPDSPLIKILLGEEAKSFTCHEQY